jgi:hypothetical protein
MTDDIVNTYAHKEALKVAKEKYTRENDMFNEYYLMHYRIIYDGMFNVAFGEFEEHYPLWYHKESQQFIDDVNGVPMAFDAEGGF